ncbi:ABC transporter permease [Burkholderia sp. 22PA0099]|uniref:ABC transporter permease n=1 Tax=Burkholderia sp. 22PA0099 TaxID=3237372 RepID=UPI0039C14604
MIDDISDGLSVLTEEELQLVAACGLVGAILGGLRGAVWGGIGGAFSAMAIGTPIGATGIAGMVSGGISSAAAGWSNR